MFKRVTASSIGALVLLALGSGCHSTCSTSAPPAGAVAAYGPAPCDCQSRTSLSPLHRWDPRPAPAVAVPAGPIYPQPVPVVPAPVAGVPNVQSTPQPPLAAAGEPIVRLSAPEGVPAEPPSAAVRSNATPAPVASAISPQTTSADPRTSPSTLPVGIPRFAEVKVDRVANGLRPHPTDGLAWLQAKGYRTVLHLQQPGEADAANKRLVEKHGMRYMSLEISSSTLSRELADQFNQLVSDPLNMPLFVYDRDGVLTGTMWYLHFRMVEGLSDEQARAQSSRFGYRDEQSDEARALFAAAQRILSTAR